MLPLTFPEGGPSLVLCIGAHCDDIEIGCGGTLAELGQALSARALPLGRCCRGDDVREAETRDAARSRPRRRRATQSRWRASAAATSPRTSTRSRTHFEALKARVNPDLVLTHRLEDRHQDHRVRRRAHLEHVPRATDPRVRDPEVRGRPRPAEPLRAALPRRPWTEGRDADGVLPEPAPARAGSREDLFRAHLRDCAASNAMRPRASPRRFYARKLVI